MRRASKDGLAYTCKECVNANSRKWREQNPDAHANWYAQNKQHKAEYFKDWRLANAERQRRKIAEWTKLNKARVNARIAKRMAKKFLATPLWADRVAIEAVYEEASRATQETGIRYEVDHIVPLQSNIVSGLHWEGNLQVIPKAENIRKLNRHWPDMP